ncbi:hypothetical protein ASZ90_016243 [hydrocarbon metagenome]|uniref:Uncharacterized protein n=1 Tax=hydrocarbon metagenome TaxID=938273 RepID=A0A0W8EZP7_9ZZZZ
MPYPCSPDSSPFYPGFFQLPGVNAGHTRGVMSWIFHPDLPSLDLFNLIPYASCQYRIPGNTGQVIDGDCIPADPWSS